VPRVTRKPGTAKQPGTPLGSSRTSHREDAGEGWLLLETKGWPRRGKLRKGSYGPTSMWSAGVLSVCVSTRSYSPKQLALLRSLNVPFFSFLRSLLPYPAHEGRKHWQQAPWLLQFLTGAPSWSPSTLRFSAPQLSPIPCDSTCAPE
jgi:hypothetical protein